MVGHTGDLEATAEACTLVDSCVKELLDVVEKQGGRWLITADHGNADDMVQRNKKDQQPIKVDDKIQALTSHTLVSPFYPDEVFLILWQGNQDSCVNIVSQ